MEQLIKIDNKEYHIDLYKKIIQPEYAPRLVVVSFLPNKQAIEILRVCIQSIQRFTAEPYELWVVDNNSPKKNTEWLLDLPNVNIVFNRTEPTQKNTKGFWGRIVQSQRKDGSYANAIALEIAVRLIDPATRYLMTLHMDTMPCKSGWLSYLQSKIHDGVAAAGVRLDTVKSPEGVLHVLGYIVDFQIQKKLRLNFFPEMPKYDVGDKLILGLKKAGYGIFACPNTLWQSELIKLIPVESPMRKLHVDRSFDEAGNVIFLHLGRGIRKSSEKYEKGVSAEDWIAFACSFLKTQNN